MKSKKKNIMFKIYMIISTLLCVGVTFWLYIYILLKGYKLISIEFLSQTPAGMPLGTEGGVYPAIIGSLYSGAIAVLIGGIISICTAIYLVFYCKNSRIHDLISVSMQALAGIPSIVIGLFGYTFIVVILNLQRSLISVSLTLAIMIIPYITVRFKKALSETSQMQMLASISLGVSKSYYIWHNALRSALPDILTSIGLTYVFAMGATAPIMLTGAVINAAVPQSLSDPIMALPYHLYVLANDGISMDNAFATAFVLVSIVLIINILSHILSFVISKAHNK